MPTYAESLAELETILRALETDAVDVDDLTARVERSAELIRLCRHKLRHAEASLDRVFDNLDNDEEGPGPDEEEDDTDDEEIPEDDTDEEEDDEDDGESEEDEDDDRDQAGGAGRPAPPAWKF
ncbi:exodeoxyribonuclease VII small subunit [Hymenobacter coccineus]|uniref:Exodeoxyribonuclease VII small subunit n=1 Tax=Hymenobacter coccineus TaxID=1908235 RepID=A0A1G1THH9_9BACT|nr:exodeoxyribonuclease VII small subunit [Hymenobacter coccineus]OGX90325.1 exodeoxyribonuclease VII small subunit [Hymenobacter coccineus]